MDVPSLRNAYFALVCKSVCGQLSDFQRYTAQAFSVWVACFRLSIVAEITAAWIAERAGNGDKKGAENRMTRMHVWEENVGEGTHPISLLAPNAATLSLKYR